MEQNNQLATISTQLSEIQNLPGVLTQNASLAERAIEKCNPVIEKVSAIDLTKVDVHVMEVSDGELATLQVKLKEAYTIMQERRKPGTQSLNNIISLFTAEEKKIVTIGEQVKGYRDAWQKEKASRTAKEDQKRQAELLKKQGEIEAKAYFTKFINDKYAEALVQLIYKLHDKFNSQTIETFPDYEVTLKNWQPAISNETWDSFTHNIGNPKPQLFTSEQVQELLNEVTTIERPRLEAEWTSYLITERDKLIEMIPSRTRELQEGDMAAANERIEKEKLELENKLAQENKDRSEAIAQNAEVNKMDAAFESAATASPVVGISKGTVVRKKYNPKTHKAHVAIVQWWVSNCMGKMTVEDLKTKLSFMRTAADKALNEGVTIEAEGLQIDDDYSTRATRRIA